MSYPVLVLNADFQPYDVWSWQKTMRKLLSTNSIFPIYDDNGNIIKHDKIIRDSRGNHYDLPAVVRLRKFINLYSRKAPYSKVNVYARDQGYCQYCGTLTQYENRTIDHVIPRSQWNPKIHHFRLSSFENVVTSCISCNAIKGNRTPEQAGMILKCKPKSINRVIVYRNKLSMLKTKPYQWEPYLNFIVEKATKI